MVCSICGRRTEDCACKKEAVLNGRWPTRTWFQNRLKKVRIIAMLENKYNARDAGTSLLEVLCALVISGIILGALWTYATVIHQIIGHFEAIGHCVKALLECVSI